MKTSHIAVLIDESGSMGGKESAVVDGVNEFINGVRVDHDGEVRLSIYKFDSAGMGNDPIVRSLFENKKIEKVKDIAAKDYTPRGSTPLNDAVIETIEKLGGYAGKKDTVMLVIMTDGYENASKASSDQVKKLIKAKEKLGWQFLYLGANQDAWAEGAKFGLTAAQSKSWTSDSIGTQNTLRYAGQTASSLTVSPEAYQSTVALAGDSVTNDAKAIEDLIAKQRDVRNQERKKK